MLLFRVAMPPAMDHQLEKRALGRLSLSDSLFTSIQELVMTALNLSAVVREEHSKGRGERMIGYLDGLDRVLSIAVQVGNSYN